MKGYLLIPALLCVIFIGYKLYYSYIAFVHSVLITRGIKQLLWAYEGVDLTQDESLMFEMLAKLQKGDIRIIPDANNEQGAYLVTETSESVFLVPRGQLIFNEIALDMFAPFLASEMMDFVTAQENEGPTLGSTIRHFESGIRAFIQMRKRGYKFEVDSQLLEEWEEEAAIYEESKDAWLIRTRAIIFKHYPDLIPVPS